MIKESLLAKRIIYLITIIAFIICLDWYKDLGYDAGEFTGYTLEIKCYTDETIYVPGIEPHDSIVKVKQLYNVKENDYISESLGKNLEKMIDIYVPYNSIETTINSSNRIILTIKELNQDHAIIEVLPGIRGISGEEIILKYGKSYKFKLGNSTYTIKFKKAKA